MNKWQVMIRLKAIVAICMALSAQVQAGLSKQADIGAMTTVAKKQLGNPFGLDDATVAQLAKTTTWRRLLLFADTPTKNDQSRVQNPKFFLSDEGEKNPQAELVAMLTAMQNRDNQAICQFVARVYFLNQSLAERGINTRVDDSSCQAFWQFADTINAKRLSLIFAEENPNNIASAFGHVWLRADADTIDDSEAVAINYTVATDRADNAIKSTTKSIFGGYAGVMEMMSYEQKAQDYLVKDGRDLWQFELDLTADEVMQIVRHIWEIKDMARPYFFTHDNCATEIVRLLDVVRDKAQLSKAVGKVVIPARMAFVLKQQNMLADERFIPSQATIRQARLNRGGDLSELLPNHNNPTQANAVYRFGVGGGFDKQADDAVYGVQLTAAYQDLLDNPNGTRQLLDLQLLSLTVRADNHRLRLDDFTLFATRSLNPVNTAKNNASDDKAAYATGMGIRLHRVIDASSPANDDALVFDVGVQRGKSWAFGKTDDNRGEFADTVCYALLDGKMQLGRINQGYRLALGPSLGCVSYLTKSVRMMTQLDMPYYYHPDRGSSNRSGYMQPTVSFAVQKDLSANHALRLTAKAERLNDASNKQAMLYLYRYF
ncbi:hypothetical protein B0189_09095 [Moraxella cuniculi]|nr:hypothetical protein B0189_09095 [Moraxella cuniculi]